MYTGLGAGSIMMARNTSAHVAQSPVRKIAVVVIIRTHVS